MPAGSRHAKPQAPVKKFGIPAVAAATLAGVAAAFVFMHGASAAPKALPGDAISLTTTDTGSGLTQGQLASTMHHNVAIAETDAARHRHLVAVAAARRARKKAAAQAAATPTPSATPTATPTPAPSQPAPVASGGGDAAHTALGECIRNAEEGGSYAWGPGNGGGAYQFAEGTWEAYGGAASEFGVAGPAYQDQIFDNAIAAGGAGNWTNYDGC
jgi:Transglycosylase-like domain